MLGPPNLELGFSGLCCLFSTLQQFCKQAHKSNEFKRPLRIIIDDFVSLEGSEVPPQRPKTAS